MNPIHHELRIHRKKSGLTQDDIALLLGTKDVSQVCRHETSPMSPLLEMCILYHLLFDEPIHGFFPEQRNAIRKRLLLRIPNIIDEFKCMESSQETDRKISFLSKVLLTLSNNL